MFSIVAATKIRAPRDNGKPDISAIVDEELRAHREKKSSHHHHHHGNNSNESQSSYNEEGGDSMLHAYVDSHSHDHTTTNSYNSNMNKSVHEITVDDVFLDEGRSATTASNVKTEKKAPKLPKPAYANEDAYQNKTMKYMYLYIFIFIYGNSKVYIYIYNRLYVCVSIYLYIYML